MRILVSNDDGIHSPGLLALAEVAREFGEVRLVAPDVEQSAMSHAITILRPLLYKATKIDGFDAYRVNGTPADCVILGEHLWGEVDLVLSGINLGLNIGHNIWHSGTVAAAKQGAFLGVPAIAFSATYDYAAPDEASSTPDYDRYADLVRQVIGYTIERGTRGLLNVNFPSDPRGMRWTRQSVRHYDGQVVTGADPMGREHHWLAVKPLEATEEGTDRWAIENGFASVTPIRLDLTDGATLDEAAAWDAVPAR